MSDRELVWAAGKLKLVRRQGWLDAGIPADEAESVADHSFRVAFMAAFLAPPRAPSRPAPSRSLKAGKGKPVGHGVDVLRMVKMALVHDLAEAKVGDLTPRSGVSRRKKAAMEEEAVRSFGNSEVLALWKEYEEGKSPEALAVREADLRERVIQAREYVLRGHPEGKLRHLWKDTDKDLPLPGIGGLPDARKRDRATP